MEEKHKDVLDRNNDLLVKNIVLTNEFYQLIQEYQVIPATMVGDVKV